MKLWHKWRIMNLTTMYRSCINKKMQGKLHDKIKHHKEQLGR